MSQERHFLAPAVSAVFSFDPLRLNNKIAEFFLL